MNPSLAVNGLSFLVQYTPAVTLGQSVNHKGAAIRLHPYLGIPKMVMPADAGTMGSCAVIFAMVWFQLLSHVDPRSGLKE